MFKKSDIVVFGKILTSSEGYLYPESLFEVQSVDLLRRTCVIKETMCWHSNLKSFKESFDVLRKADADELVNKGRLPSLFSVDEPVVFKSPYDLEDLDVFYFSSYLSNYLVELKSKLGVLSTTNISAIRKANEIEIEKNKREP